MMADHRMPIHWACSDITKRDIFFSIYKLLRDALNKLNVEHSSRHEQDIERLAGDSNWQQLDPEQRNLRMSEKRLTISTWSRECSWPTV